MDVIDVFNVKKEYLKGIPKYPTRFPSLLIKILIEHFSDTNSTILDPLCGSGIIPAICELYYPDRIVYSGDLNPHSQTVFSELLKFYSNLCDNCHQKKSDLVEIPEQKKKICSNCYKQEFYKQGAKQTD
jgi:hypothetical protein